MDRDYFSVRQGKKPSSISLEHLRDIVRIQYGIFEKDGCFQHQFGYNCVDAGYVPGQSKISIRDRLILIFGSRGDSIDPTLVNFKKMDIFELFDLIEFLYDNVAKPITSNYHFWNNCGIHITGDADYSLGKSEWRKEINKHLENFEPPYTFNIHGKIEELPSSKGLQQLSQFLTSHNAPETIDDKVNRACALFLKRGATIDDKRDALKNLADVLELLRDDLKSYVPSNEENRLFEIANQFGIRHHNNTQQTQYNQGSYYYWIFYSYLSTIDLLARLKKEQTG